MAATLFFRLHTDGSLAWLNDGKGAVSGPPAASVLEAATQIVVTVPGESVLLAQTAVMTRNHAQLLKAVPYVLEDQLISPVEDTHFAVAEQVVAGAAGVAVVARAQVKAWLEQLAAYGVVPDILVPESLALPWREGAATLLLEDSSALLRYAQWQSISSEFVSLPEILRLVNANRSDSLTLDVFDFRAQSVNLNLPTTYYPERPSAPLSLFAQALCNEPSLNLLQGEFAPVHRRAPLQRLWRIAALLAGMAIALSGLYAVLERWQLQRQSDQLDIAMQTVLHDSFPNLTRDDDPARRMSSELARLRGGAHTSPLLRILGQIAPVLGSTTRISLRNIDYRNAVMEIGLRAPDVPTLDSMRERLASGTEFKVEVTAANPTEGAVDGRLRISGGKP